MPFLQFRVKRLAILWCVVALFLLVAAGPPDPDQPIVESNPPPRPPVIAAWLRGSTAVRPMVVTVSTHADAYSEVSAFSYTIEANGTLTANNPVNDKTLVEFAGRKNNIKVIPTVSSTWDSTNITRVLKDTTLRAKHIEAIMKIARSPLVDGIDLDYENLPPDTRQAYTEFVTSLGALIHREGKTLAITVPAKVADEDGCVICKFADYSALGIAADQIRVMAYEYHGKSGGPAPNAPIWWVRQVMQYTISRVPREKAVLGIHLYAYDWGGKDTPAYWWEDVQYRLQQYHGTVTFVESDARGLVGESILNYAIQPRPCQHYLPECTLPPPERHTVYFVDAKYVAAAWDIVKDLQLAGIVMWRPGGEDPEIWNVLNPVEDDDPKP